MKEGKTSLYGIPRKFQGHSLFGCNFFQKKTLDSRLELVKRAKPSENVQKIRGLVSTFAARSTTFFKIAKIKSREISK